MPDIRLTLDEMERQMILLAIAELALSRPGWDYSLQLIAVRLQGAAMFDAFKRANADRVKAERSPLGRDVPPPVS